MSPSTVSLRSRMLSARYGPRTVELFHSVPGGEPATTYLGDSLKNGAPGSSSAVRADQAGANSSKVRRPSKIARQVPVTAPMASPILGSKPNSNVQDGFSYTPSRAMNSCTLITPIVINSLVLGPGRPGTRRTRLRSQTHRRRCRRPAASAASLDRLEPGGEVPQIPGLGHDAQAREAGGPAGHPGENLDDVVHMALGVGAARNGQPDQVHGGRGLGAVGVQAEHHGSDLAGPYPAFLIQRAGQSLPGILQRVEMGQQGAR